MGGLWERFGAHWIDALLVGACAVVGGFIDGLIGGSERLLVLLVLIAAAPIEIYQWYLVTKTGQTLGKRWLKLKIVKMDGSAVDFMSGVVLRSWPLLAFYALSHLISVETVRTLVIDLVLLVDAVLVLGSERRALHDYIAGTRVISVAALPA
jgi:uncharacterized RDD family membrane protein YckC